VKIVAAVQRTPEWEAARLGIPTASNFSKILTPWGKVSTQADAYLHQLVAERLLGCPVNIEATAWMDRGTISEAEAVAFYELQHGVDTEPVGFVTTDDGIAGCSPDRLVGKNGGLEIKCPSAATHVGYLLDVEPRKYWPQIQGALWITGRDWWDFLSYCPGLPPAQVRFERAEEYIASLARVVTTFAERVDEAHRKLAALIGKAAA
jgi:hypothetical protein